MSDLSAEMIVNVYMGNISKRSSLALVGFSQCYVCVDIVYKVKNN